MRNYFRDIIRIFTSSGQNDDTVKAFHKWILDPEYRNEKDEALSELWKATEGNMSADAMEKSLAEVRRKAGISRKRTETVRILHLGWMKYAAAVVIMAVSVFTTWHIARETYGNVAMIEDFTNAGERKTVELPDGSKVYVNSSSLLIYPEDFKGRDRTVFLIGEAVFDVRKNPGRPFTVKSGTMDITALGTRFNVSAYSEDDDVTATLIDGKIKVECGGEKGTSYILHPGEQAMYSKNTGESTVCEADMEVVTAWQSGVLVFRGVTLDDIAKVLHRRYGVVFHIDPGVLVRDRYSFRFPEDAAMDEVLDIMKAVITGLDYRIEGNECFIMDIR